jgi:hypothetical protein
VRVHSERLLGINMLACVETAGRDFTMAPRAREVEYHMHGSVSEHFIEAGIGPNGTAAAKRGKVARIRVIRSHQVQLGMTRKRAFVHLGYVTGPNDGNARRVHGIRQMLRSSKVPYSQFSRRLMLRKRSDLWANLHYDRARN